MPIIKDGSKTFQGVDTNSGSRRPGYFSSMVNRSLRGQKNDTRPPFKQWNTFFYSIEDKTIFENGAVKCCFFYRGIKTAPFVMIAVHDRILAGRILANSIVFEPAIYVGIDPTRQSGYFCKAESVLVYQNGYDSPIYWLGDPSVKMKQVYNSSYVGQNPMMVGNFMVYGHGRFHVATENDLIYSSDHIYSQGIALSDQEAVLRFSESAYPSSGDGFGAPSDMGRLNGMCMLKSSGDKEGQGGLAAFYEKGAQVINVGLIPRNSWTATQMQQILFEGRGCSASGSIINVGDDIFFRDSDYQVSTLKFAASQSKGYQSISFSDEVSKYLYYDNTSLIKFSKSISIDRRLMVSCAIGMEKSNIGNYHFFARGLAVLDFQTRDKDFKWDGLWTGPRVVDCCETFGDGVKKSCFVSHDSDSINRLYYLDSGQRGDDLISNIPRKIFSFYTQPELFHSNEISNIGDKILKDQYIKYKNSKGVSVISSVVSVSGSISCSPLIKPEKVGCDTCDLSSDSCSILLTNSNNGDIVGNDGCSRSVGYSFDVTTFIEGSVEILFDIVSAEIKNEFPKQTESCNSCKTVTRCPDTCNLFQYTF